MGKLTPVENVWQFLRKKRFSNRVFAAYDAKIPLAKQPWRVVVTGLGDWASGQAG